MTNLKKPNRYTRILEDIFKRHFLDGVHEITFERDEIIQVANELGIKLPKNLGDLLYSFRYRTTLPPTIVSKAPEGFEWIIRPGERSQYRLSLTQHSIFIPSQTLVKTKILDATPGVIIRYAMNDEQALLAKLRYNRLIDIFTGLTCYSLQSHFRTTLEGGSQIETDEIYIGMDKRGVHYVLPIQAKSGRDKIGVVQIEQDFEMCSAKFPYIIYRSIAAQIMGENLIALFEFENTTEGIKVSSEKHYYLVKTEDLSPEELESYQIRQS